ncbi:RagB/SusD family nutrient uptake outer membrane protein [Flavihumibacter sp. R14]|nr:RagB/SusD family nutrient uptake outer membrane protein [Flavihumibacter soli]
MKRYLIIILALVLASCQKDFLNKLPQDKLVPETAFIDNNNFKTYTWGLYDYFSGYGNGASNPPAMRGDYVTDNMNETRAGQQSEYAYQTKFIQANGNNTLSQVPSEWNFSYVRRVNVMLDNIDGSKMSDTDKKHWRSVGYFFRALRYYDLISAFGDVPWVEHALSDTSTSVLFGPRTPRDIVAKNMLDNLIYAEANIKPAGDGKNTINTNVVRALISRFGLFEGTWRKNHGLNDANTYLQASKIASEKLMAVYPALITNYDDVFNSEDLDGKPGIILFKQYAPNLANHASPRFIGSTSWFWDLTKDAVESYLCSDGKPVSTSEVYAGDIGMYNEFRNRDRRLYYSVVPPYKVTIPKQPTWTNTANPADAEYINLMKNIGGVNKALPVSQWSKNWDTGTIISQSPHFRVFNAGQTQMITELGYLFWKFYNRIPLDNANCSTNDAPLFRIEEVLLNYAEVTYELGSFNQAVADATINKLRARVSMPNLVLSQVNASFDTRRDAAVDPILWEIRRERRVELMGEGFRLNDLKRWKKGTYLNKQPLGVWARNADYGNRLKINGGGTQGYVEYFGMPAGWLDKYYLEPLPTQDLALNKKLTQNPGY